MKFSRSIVAAASTLALAGIGIDASAQSFSEGFNGTAIPSGWLATNLSTRASTGNPWTDGPGISDPDSGEVVVGPHEGDGFAIANYSSIGSGQGTISNWLISPEMFGISNGDTFSFFTTTTAASDYPDRLEVRLSTAGAGTSVGTSVTSTGTFTTLLLSVNSALAVGGYPEDWTQYTVTVSGLAAPVDGRLAFRYFVTAGGPTGTNSNIIGVDDFAYTAAAAVPEPGTWALMAGGFGLLCARRLRDRSGKR